MTLLTTTVSVDAQRDDYNQNTINLVQGDAGTRRFQMVPISGGVPVSMTNVAYAKVLCLCNESPLAIDCAIESGKIYMEPTAALVASQCEWQCQLVLLNASQGTLTSMKFTIIVHDKLFTGDAVEHTNVQLTNVVYYPATRYMTFYFADNTTIDVQLPLATENQDGLMSATNYNHIVNLIASVTQFAAWLNQDVTTTGSPTFANLTVGSVSINGTTGVVTGLRFT